MSMTDNAAIGVMAVIGILFLIVLGPLLAIWSLNTLFGLSIAYTLKTWVAALLLGGAFQARARGKE